MPSLAKFHLQQAQLVSNNSHTKGKHWIFVLICSASTHLVFLLFFGCFLCLSSHVRRVSPALYPFVSASRSFFPAHKLGTLLVQLPSAVVLFRAYDLPVVSQAQGGTLISTGSAVFTGSLSVLSSAEGLCLREKLARRSCFAYNDLWLSLPPVEWELHVP